MNNDSYKDYFADQQIINSLIHEKFDDLEINGKADLDDFVINNAILREKLRNSIDRFLQLSKERKELLKPIENVTKSVSLMADVDERTFDKMNSEEKEELLDGINRLSNVINEYGSKLGTDPNGQAILYKPYKVAISRVDRPIIICKAVTVDIENRRLTIKLMALKENESQTDICNVRLFLLDADNKRISDSLAVEVSTEIETEQSLILTRYEEDEMVYLVLQVPEDNDDEAIRIIPVELD